MSFRMKRLRRFCGSRWPALDGCPRHADVWLAGICAEHLVDGRRAAGLIVARPTQWRLHQ